MVFLTHGQAGRAQQKAAGWHHHSSAAGEGEIVGKVRSWCNTSTTGINYGAVAGAPCASNFRCLVLHLNSEGEGEKKKQERKWSVETHVPVTGYSHLSKWHEWYFVWLLIKIIGKKDKRSGWGQKQVYVKLKLCLGPSDCLGLFDTGFLTFCGHGQCLAHSKWEYSCFGSVSLVWGFICPISTPVISTTKKS